MRLARGSIIFDRLGRDGKAEWFDRWLGRWRTKLTHFADQSSDQYGLYNVEGPLQAIKEIPNDLRCYTEWTNPPKIGRGGRRKIRYSK
jgi:hypothetical protein